MECTYKDLKAWQKSMDLVTYIYAVTKKFPWEEKDGLSSQMRRAAVSIPANISEGQGRRYKANSNVSFVLLAGRCLNSKL